MANTKLVGRHYKITASDNGSTLELGQGGWGGAAALLVQFVPTTFTGSITVEGRVAGPDAEAAGLTAVPVAPIPYRAYNTGGAVATLAIASAAITGAATILIPCAGLSVFLAITATVGSCDVYVQPVADAGAP